MSMPTYSVMELWDPSAYCDADTLCERESHPETGLLREQTQGRVLRTELRDGITKIDRHASPFVQYADDLVVRKTPLLLTRPESVGRALIGKEQCGVMVHLVSKTY